MGRNRNDNQKDQFDRAFIGSPGFMIVLVLVIIIGSVIFNYFK
ncbi:hypothetical protein J32TS6_13930 [Virgibacillus pantothenticus]|nr:hypothetical protein J32TS6_13930 [Virgibacillus pantothenticus]